MKERTAKFGGQVRQKAGTCKAEVQRKQARFVEAYISNGGNGRQAAIAAGYAPKSAEVTASRMLRDAKVSKALEVRAAELTQQFLLTTEHVLRECARIAFFDIGACFDPDGRLKQPHEIDENTRRAIASFKTTETPAGTNETPGVVLKEIRPFDKNAALERAFKHLGLFQKDNSQLGKAARRFFLVPRKADAGISGDE